MSAERSQGAARRLRWPGGHRPRRLPRSVPKFVVFGVICAVLMVVLGLKLGNLSLFSSRAGYSAQLHDVTGLNAGDPVELAGVPVGQVSSVAVQRGHALVGLSINPSVTVRTTTEVGLRWRNVLGQKVVYLYPASGGRAMPPGSTVPLSHDVSDASVNALLNSLGPLLQAINPQQANAFVENVSGALQGDTAEIDQLINNGATVAKTVGDLNLQVGTVIDSLDQVLTAVASRSGDLQSLVTNLQTVGASLAAHNSTLDDVVNNLSAVSGDLAQLVSNNRPNLDGSINDLNTVMTELDQHQQELSQGLSSIGAGLAPYTQISAWGQWFQIQPVYTCLANETSCSYYESANPPAGSGFGGGLPMSTPAPPSGFAVPSASSSPPGAASLSQMLSTVAGSGSSGGGSTP